MSATKRSAFTLVEILVVIAIIAILASLIMGAVMMVRRKVPETTTRNDILQLSTALSNFHAKYKFYPPNRLRLCSSGPNVNSSGYKTSPSPIDAQSIAAINKMFLNIQWNSTPIKWDGVNTTVDVTLEGDQCLVFFLGGIPGAAGQLPQGFSTNANDPSTPGGDRIKFMNTFDASRIVTVFHNNSFPSYLDGFAANLDATKKKPYVYFSSMSLFQRENGYDPAPHSLGVSPYVQQIPNNQQLPISSQTPASNALVKYWNSTTFQIISAGADGQFGPGCTTAAALPVVWPALSPAQCNDDMANFNSSQLGAPD